MLDSEEIGLVESGETVATGRGVDPITGSETTSSDVGVLVADVGVIVGEGVVGMRAVGDRDGVIASTG